MKDFKELEVWQKGHEMAIEVFNLIKTFLSEEKYGLTSQMRRSSQSIPTNIAEGCGRNSQKELLRFSSIAMGSASELEYQLIISKDIGFIKPQDYKDINGRLLTLKKMLNAFMKYLKTQITNS
jgi:four helix bundle protein